MYYIVLINVYSNNKCLVIIVLLIYNDIKILKTI